MVFDKFWHCDEHEREALFEFCKSQSLLRRKASKILLNPLFVKKALQNFTFQGIQSQTKILHNPNLQANILRVIWWKKKMGYCIFFKVLNRSTSTVLHQKRWTDCSQSNIITSAIWILNWATIWRGRKVPLIPNFWLPWGAPNVDL